MAVVSVGEIWAGRSGRKSRDWTTEYDRVYAVQTNSTTDDSTVVIGFGAVALGLPVKGQVHPSDSLAFCVDIRASNSSDDPYEWQVTCTYSTDLTIWSNDPTALLPVFKWSTEWVEQGRITDLDDEPILSSSFEPFDPPASIPLAIDVCTVTLTRAVLDHAANIAKYRNRVNDAEFVLDGVTCAAKTLICIDVTADMIEKKGVFYRAFTYTLKRRTDGSDPWQYFPLDVGFYEWDITNSRWRQVMTDAGQPIAHPILLDGLGMRLDLSTDPPVNLVYRVKDTADFSTIFS